jgi:hypothetical protein
MRLIGTACDRLRVQGYAGLDDDALSEVEPWLRWSPAVCTAVIAAGVVLASPVLLWALVPFAAAGALMRRHPFDYVYNYGVRRLIRTPALPGHGAPRRFACGLAAAWLVATGALFALGAATAGYVAGGILTGVGLLVATTHLCIPSIIYGLLFGRAAKGSAAATAD